jgi:hypothetical protein
LGHAVGIGHSSEPTSVMHWKSKPQSYKHTFNKSDVSSLQKLYGKKK